MVIALSAETRNSIGASLKSLGSLKSQEVDVKELASLGELPAALKKFWASGILLEVMTSIKASQNDKEATHHLVEFYPFAKFKLVGKEVMVLGKARSLEEFVHGCGQFNPRTIRRGTREIGHLAVYLSSDDTFDNAEKPVTVNISEAGCFVYSIR